MAFAGVDLYAHERDWMLGAVQKTVEIAAEVRPHDVLVIPVPDDIARARLDGARPDISWDAEVGKVEVDEPALLDQALEVPLAQLRPVHTHRVLADVHEGSH